MVQLDFVSARLGLHLRWAANCQHDFLAIFHVLRGSTLNYWVRLPAGPEKAAKQSAGGARSTNARDNIFHLSLLVTNSKKILQDAFRDFQGRSPHFVTM